jgi:hypothetical protein
MGIGEDHAILGQEIDVGRGNLGGLGGEAMNVPIAQVIAKNQYHVWRPRDREAQDNGYKETENNSFHEPALAPNENANKNNRPKVWFSQFKASQGATVNGSPHNRLVFTPGGGEPASLGRFPIQDSVLGRGRHRHDFGNQFVIDL